MKFKKALITGGISVFLLMALAAVLFQSKPQVADNSPEWRPIHIAIEEAAEADKLVLVDVFEQGCKYCRAMAREVYPDSTVRSILDAFYIPAKIDGNSPEPITVVNRTLSAAEFARESGAYAFPTTLILDGSGNVVSKFTGYMTTDELRSFLYRNRKS